MKNEVPWSALGSHQVLCFHRDVLLRARFSHVSLLSFGVYLAYSRSDQ